MTRMEIFLYLASAIFSLIVIGLLYGGVRYYFG